MYNDKDIIITSIKYISNIWYNIPYGSLLSNKCSPLKQRDGYVDYLLPNSRLQLCQRLCK